MVRGDNGDEIHALVCGKSLFGMDHFLVGTVTPVWRKEEICAGRFRSFGIARESAADQFDLAVHVCCDAVDCTDESAAAAADHTITNFSTHDEGIGDRSLNRFRGSETDRGRLGLGRLGCKPITEVVGGEFLKAGGLAAKTQ